MWLNSRAGAFPLKVLIIDNRDLSDLTVVSTTGIPTVKQLLSHGEKICVCPTHGPNNYILRHQNLNVVFTGV